MIFAAQYLSLLLTALLLPTEVQGHACLTEPRSRQWYAFQDGGRQFWGDSAIGLPEQKSGPFGYQAGGYDYGPCGRKRANDLSSDYTTNYVDAFGGEVNWVSQAIYDEGQVIDIEVTVTANHKGHFEFYLCTDVDNPTQECFDENPLEFVSDEYNGGTVDPDYPFRGYMAPSGASDRVDDSEGRQIIRHQYKLPEGISGDQVLLQWQWVSFLGCKATGVPDYDWPAHWNIGDYFGDIGEYDDLGRLPSAGNFPQHYWQCSEVSILPGNPVAPVTPSPVSPTVPETPAPVAPPTDSPVAPMTPAPIVSETPVPVTPTAPVVDEPCAQCGPAEGKNQPECSGQSEDSCLRMIDQESKCSWSPCDDDEDPDPCGICGPAPGENQPECNGNTEERCLQMIDNEGKCSWSVCP